MSTYDISTMAYRAKRDYSGQWANDFMARSAAIHYDDFYFVSPECYPTTIENQLDPRLYSNLPQPMRTMELAPQPPTLLDRLQQELKLKVYMYATSSLIVPNPSHSPGDVSVNERLKPCKLCIWNALYSSKVILHTRCPTLFRHTSVSFF